jgi:hypothetical protein
MTPPACATCQRIRWFMGIAAFLVVCIHQQPQWAMALATAMPDPLVIGLGLTVAGGAGFAIRLYRHRRGISASGETTRDA